MRRIGWPSRRRNRLLCICHRFLTRDALPLHAWHSRSFVDGSDPKLGQFIHTQQDWSNGAVSQTVRSVVNGQRTVTDAAAAAICERSARQGCHRKGRCGSSMWLINLASAVLMHMGAVAERNAQAHLDMAQGMMGIAGQIV